MIGSYHLKDYRQRAEMSTNKALKKYIFLYKISTEPLIDSLLYRCIHFLKTYVKPYISLCKVFRKVLANHRIGTQIVSKIYIRNANKTQLSSTHSLCDLFL